MEHSAQHQSASSAPPYTYVAIDLKSFYASVECVERGLDPLTTNLVVADPSRTDSFPEKVWPVRAQQAL